MQVDAELRAASIKLQIAKLVRADAAPEDLRSHRSERGRLLGKHDREFEAHSGVYFTTVGGGLVIWPIGTKQEERSKSMNSNAASCGVKA